MVEYTKGNMFISFSGRQSAEMSFPNDCALIALDFLNNLLKQPFDGRYMSGGGEPIRIQTLNAFGYSEYRYKINHFFGNWWYIDDLKDIIKILSREVVTLKVLVEKYKTRKEIINVLKDKSIDELNYLLGRLKDD
jgi:hypothetical protein